MARFRGPGRVCLRWRRSNRGDAMAIVVVWPVLLVATVVLTAHAFIVANARAEAEVAASEALRAAWHHTAMAHPDHDGGLAMARAARDAAQGAAGWRWWQPDAAGVYSDWCAGAGARPAPGRAGWVRVVVVGEVFGPLGALWPDRLDGVFAAAEGPAVLTGRPEPAAEPGLLPAAPTHLPVC